MAPTVIDGRDLAELHGSGTAADDGIRLVAYAESPRDGDWSLRSALVRYAQPEPARASAVLELVRRTDGALKPSLRLLERSEAATHPGLSGGRSRIDARTADLARVAVAWSDELDRVMTEYESVEPLPPEERELIPLLAVAVELDALGDVLAGWADDRRTARPDDAVDTIARRAFGMLAALGVERERRPARRS